MNRIIAYLVSWAVFSSLADTMTKSIQQQFPFPTTVTLFQFGVSWVCAVVILQVVKWQEYRSGWKLIGLKPGVVLLGLTHQIGFLATNFSFGRVSVPLVQTVKATDPLFSLILSIIFLRQSFGLWTYLSLIPIIGGVICTALNDLSFEVLGFAAAMLSNLCFSSRSVLSKNYLSIIDEINLYCYLSLLGFFFTLPIWLLTDAYYFILNPHVLFDGLGLFNLIRNLVICGIFHFLYNQISYLVLKLVNPLTHAIFNVFRRVLVIVSSIIYFRVFPTTLSGLGIILVFVGVSVYLMTLKSTKSAGGGPSAPASTAVSKGATIQLVPRENAGGGKKDKRKEIKDRKESQSV